MVLRPYMPPDESSEKSIGGNLWGTRCISLKRRAKPRGPDYKVINATFTEFKARLTRNKYKK
jgi:hypothetical protein